MKHLAQLDSRTTDNYNGVIRRVACRAIIQIGKKLVMIYSDKYNDYKFPGGGAKDGETLIECLIREVKEESGIIINKSNIKEFGKVTELRGSTLKKGFLFFQTSYYYLCEIDNDTKERNLDDYELDANYEVIHIEPKEALFKNSFSKKDNAKRESKVLEILMESELWN